MIVLIDKSTDMLEPSHGVSPKIEPCMHSPSPVLKYLMSAQPEPNVLKTLKLRDHR